MNSFVPLVVPGFSSSSSSSLASTSRPKDQSKSSGESETSTNPMTPNVHAGNRCGTNPDMQASGSRGSAHTENEMDVEDPTPNIPGHSPSHKISSAWRARARTFLWKRDLRGCWAPPLRFTSSLEDAEEDKETPAWDKDKEHSFSQLQREMRWKALERGRKRRITASVP